jgi:hypothetical protein
VRARIEVTLAYIPPDCLEIQKIFLRGIKSSVTLCRVMTRALSVHFGTAVVPDTVKGGSGLGRSVFN